MKITQARWVGWIAVFSALVAPALAGATEQILIIPGPSVTDTAPLVIPSSTPTTTTQTTTTACVPAGGPNLQPGQACCPGAVQHCGNGWCACYADGPTKPAPNGQAAHYEKAGDARSRAATANAVGAGLWAGVGALCGYNCFGYMTNFRKQKAKVLEANDALNKASKDLGACMDKQNGVSGPESEELTKLQNESVELRGLNSKNSDAMEDCDRRRKASEKKAAEAKPASDEEGKKNQAQLAEDEKKYNAEMEGLLKKNRDYAARMENNEKQQKAARDSIMAKDTAEKAKACVPQREAHRAAETKANAEQAALDKQGQGIMKFGRLCTYGSMGAAVADLGISGLYAKNIMGGLPSLAGAAPGVAALGSEFLNKNEKPAAKAEDMGLASCATTAASMAMIALKTVNYFGDKSGADKDYKKAKELKNGASLDLRRFLNSIMPEAFAAADLNLASCEGPMDTHSARVACATEGDSFLRGFLNEEPGRERAIAAAFTSTFGSSWEKFVGGSQPPDFGKVAGLMTRDNPQLAPNLFSLYKNTENRTRLSLGYPADQEYTANAAPFQVNPGPPASTDEISNAAPVVTPPPPGYAKAAQVLSELNRLPAETPPGAASGSDDNIFQVISKRYQLLNDRLAE